ncbi:AI-2E family transporter [Halocola ammonii]
MTTKRTIQEPIDLTYKILVITALLFTGAYFFGQIFMPFLFALILSLALLPSCQRLEGIGFNRFFSIFTVLIVLSVIVLGFGTFFYWQFKNFASDLPKLSVKSTQLISEWLQSIENSLGISLDDPMTQIQDNLSGILQTSSGILQGTFSTVSQFFTFLVMVPVYTFFILYSRNRLRVFIEHQNRKGRKRDYLGLVDDIKDSVRDYLKGMSIVILIIAALNTTGLLIIGIDYAILLGVFSALLTVIPYVGVVIGALIPIFVAFITKDSLIYPVAVVGLYSLVQFLEGNLITPRILGNTVHLNPLIIILGLVMAGYLAGIPGMIIAVPVLAIIKIAFEHSRTFSSVATLLGEKE